MSSSAQSGDPGERSPEEIRREIESTREELGDTVAAVAAKTDVKAQAEAKVEDLKAEAKEAVPRSPQEARSFFEEHQKAIAIAGAVIGALVAIRLLRGSED